VRHRRIEVDEDVWSYLKQEAVPFEDTPNSVLRRILLIDKQRLKSKASNQDKNEVRHSNIEPKFLRNSPAALEQILEVVFHTKRGFTRQESTNFVARNRSIAPQTVIDKYCRQLYLNARQFDNLLADPSLSELKKLLKRIFPEYGDVIEDFVVNISHQSNVSA